MPKLKELSKWHQKFETLEEVTQHLQKMLIDFEPLQTDHLEIIGFNRPSDLLGGDYIGLIPQSDNSFLISIGDVMGKGISAGFLMGMIHGALKGITLQKLEPNEILTLLNKALIRDFKRFNAFATFLVSSYDEKSRVLKWANAGQNFPLHWKNNTRRCQPLQLKGVMIGVIEPLNFQLQQIQLEKGDIVFWYSDGLVELMNENREQYGIERVILCIEKYGEYGLQEIIKHLQTDLFNYCGNSNFSDDISFIALKTV
jgi:sigma-B regulation protein RsbU (phosphoserine phosphatase)